VCVCVCVCVCVTLSYRSVRPAFLPVLLRTVKSNIKKSKPGVGDVLASFEDPGINISTVFCENLLKIEMYLSV
jgi:hypothetical protein